MPILFLLHRTSLEFAYGASKLSPWVRIVQDEELLLDRGRSMFAVRWFGTHYPLSGFSLCITIANIAALRQRYDAVKAPPPSRIDLSAPLGALMGAAIGSMLNPLVLVPFVYYAAVKGLWGVLLFLLKYVGIPVALGVGLAFLPPAVSVVVGGAAASGLLSLLITDWIPVGGQVGLLAVAGDFVMAFSSFLTALTANWHNVFDQLVEIAGPILSEINKSASGPEDPSHGVGWWKVLFVALAPLTDQIALLLPMLTAAIAFVVFVGGPLLSRLAITLPPFLTFVTAAIEALKALFDDLTEGLKKVVQWPSDLLRETLEHMASMLNPIGPLLSTLLDKYVAFLKGRGPALSSAFKIWLDQVKDDLSTVFRTHPLVRLMGDLINAIGSALNALNEGFWTGAKGEARHAFGPLGDIIVDKIRGGLSDWWNSGEPFVPTLKLPDAAALLGALEAPRSWDDMAQSPNIGPMPTIPAALVTPTSIFGGTRRELKAELKEDPATALARAHADEMRLRGFIFDVVARHFPASAQKNFSKLRGVLQELDRALTPLEPESAKREHPVRALPEDPQVLPVVGRMTIRGHGVSESELRQWLPVLRNALGRQSYLKVA